MIFGHLHYIKLNLTYTTMHMYNVSFGITGHCVNPAHCTQEKIKRNRKQQQNCPAVIWPPIKYYSLTLRNWPTLTISILQHVLVKDSDRIPHLCQVIVINHGLESLQLLSNPSTLLLLFCTVLRNYTYHHTHIQPHFAAASAWMMIFSTSPILRTWALSNGTRPQDPMEVS